MNFVRRAFRLATLSKTRVRLYPLFLGCLGLCSSASSQYTCYANDGDIGVVPNLPRLALFDDIHMSVPRTVTRAFFTICGQRNLGQIVFPGRISFFPNDELNSMAPGGTPIGQVLFSYQTVDNLHVSAGTDYFAPIQLPADCWVELEFGGPDTTCVFAGPAEYGRSDDVYYRGNNRIQSTQGSFNLWLTGFAVPEPRTSLTLLILLIFFAKPTYGKARSTVAGQRTRRYCS